jgi:hypothetical protein
MEKTVIISIKSILKSFINLKISFKGINLIYRIYKKLLSGKAAKDWVSTRKLDKTLGLCLSEDDAKEVLIFMKKYFLEVDPTKENVRLRPWALKAFNIKL